MLLATFNQGLGAPLTTQNHNSPSYPHQTFSAHIERFGTPLPVVDHTNVLRICMQNTQYDFKIYGDGLEISNIISNLKNIGASMFVPISPNINWKNRTNWTKTKNIFRSHFQQVHISTTSSNIGNDPLYFNKNLIGGSAILTFGLWSSKVSISPSDESGHGIFSVTTIQGKGQKCIPFLSAYIAVQKGSNIGTESLFAKQVTLHERDSIRNGCLPSRKFCPRVNAIQQLNQIIHHLQQQQMR